MTFILTTLPVTIFIVMTYEFFCLIVSFAWPVSAKRFFKVTVTISVAKRNLLIDAAVNLSFLYAFCIKVISQFLRVRPFPAIVIVFYAGLVVNQHTGAHGYV